MGVPRSPDPLPLDDDDDPRPRRRRDDDTAAVRPTARALWGPVKWLLLGLGFVLAVGAFAGNAIQAGALAGLACFMGIAARVAQAEEHYRP